jgi:hypothetical protein
MPAMTCSITLPVINLYSIKNPLRLHGYPLNGGLGCTLGDDLFSLGPNGPKTVGAPHEYISLRDDFSARRG